MIMFSFRGIKSNVQIIERMSTFHYHSHLVHRVLLNFPLVYIRVSLRNDVSSIIYNGNEMSFTVGGIRSRIGSGNWTANLECANETDESARIIDNKIDHRHSTIT